MKTQLFILSFAASLFTIACGGPNRPVQTAKDMPDSLTQLETPGSTPVKADSVRGTGTTDQMVPDNTGPSTPTPAPKK